MPLPGPDTRVVELRVPGLVGTSGETLLDAVSTVDVAGDGVGRVIRPSDRLHRPAPGPVLSALGRSIPRTLEGYLWSGMTSGGAAKATWALLFPFSLANVAFWMLPPTRPDSRLSRALGAICRALLRVTALLLTMLLVSQLAVIGLDLLATQCLAPGSSCLPSAPSWLRDAVPMRTLIGVLPLLVVIYVLHRVSATNWTVNVAEGHLPGVQREEGAPHRAGREKGAPALPAEGLHADPETPGLRALHTVVALTVVAFPLLGGPLRVPHAAADVIAWIGVLALIVSSLVVGAIGVDIGRVARRTLITFASLLVGYAAVRRTPLPAELTGGGLSGTDGTVETLGAAMVVLTVLFGLALVPAALLARRGWRDKPRRLRPWLGGAAAGPVLALAGLLGGGFGAGLAVSLRKVVGAEELKLPETYQLVTVLWGAGLVLAALLSLLGFAVAVPLRRRRRGIPEIVELMEISKKQETEAAAAWARSSWERRNLHHLVLTVSLAMAAGGATLLILRFGFGKLPGWLEPLSTIGLFALGALAAGLLRVVYSAAKNPQRSRHLGALADLVCFWPRAAHPTVPPCYALKVVPELTARVKEHLAEPNTRVVLGGNNLGSLLTVIAAARLAVELPEADRERVGMVTSGSPLQWGYQRAFPAVLPQEALATLFGEFDGRWRALCRGTDVFGGGVTTWRHQVVDGNLLGDGYLPGGGVGPLVTSPESNGVLILGGDHWLPDPARPPAGPTGRHRWAPGVLRHIDYLVDPEWDHAVAMAAGLERPGRPFRGAGEQFPLFPDVPSTR